MVSWLTASAVAEKRIARQPYAMLAKLLGVRHMVQEFKHSVRTLLSTKVHDSVNVGTIMRRGRSTCQVLAQNSRELSVLIWANDDSSARIGKDLSNFVFGATPYAKNGAARYHVFE